MKLRALFIIVVLAVVLPWPGWAVTREELVCPLREGWEEGSEACPCEKGWRPTEEQLQEILDDHREWVEQWHADPTIPGQALLCNADLQEADLKSVPLDGANLAGARLRWASLEGASLNFVNLSDGDLTGANLRGASISYANLEGCYLSDADLGGALLTLSTLRRAGLSGADLTGARLPATNLRYANLRRANLEGAHLSTSSWLSSVGPFKRPKVSGMKSSWLGRANTLMDFGVELKAEDAAKLGENMVAASGISRHALKERDLFTHLEGADLSDASLENAELSGIEMGCLAGGIAPVCTKLLGTNINNARLEFLTLTGSVFAPVSRPSIDHLGSIVGLSTVTFPLGLQAGLVQLRDLLIRVGLRDLEREATFAIESNKARHARGRGTGLIWLGGWLQLIFFEWTTGWGLYPGRALAIVLGLLVGFGFVYAIAIWDPPPDWTRHGEIVRILPAERLVYREGVRQLAEIVTAEPVASSGLVAALRWGLYFSMLSAFHIGWRDLNVGSWLTRMQFTEYALRGRGWVRFVSGLQSLISVYLVAMWVLTYFGRPFQ